MLALQGSDLVVLLKWGEANRALASHEVLSRHRGQAVKNFRAGGLLRDSIIQAKQQLVVLRSDVAGEKAVYFHRCQSTGQDRVCLRAACALVQSPAMVAAVRGLARVTLAVVGAVAMVLAVVTAMVTVVVTVVMAVAVAST